MKLTNKALQPITGRLQLWVTLKSLGWAVNGERPRRGCRTTALHEGSEL